MEKIVSCQKGRFTYKMLKNGSFHKEDNGNRLQHLYTTIYNSSDNAKSANFWDEIIIKDSGVTLSTLRQY
jgi:hypothetical protein